MREGSSHFARHSFVLTIVRGARCEMPFGREWYEAGFAQVCPASAVFCLDGEVAQILGGVSGARYLTECNADTNGVHPWQEREAFQRAVDPIDPGWVDLMSEFLLGVGVSEVQKIGRVNADSEDWLDQLAIGPKDDRNDSIGVVPDMVNGTSSLVYEVHTQDCYRVRRSLVSVGTRP